MARADEGSTPLWPWLLVGGGAAAAVIVFRHHLAHADTSPAHVDASADPANDNAAPVASAPTPARDAPRWICPVPMWRGRRAEISDGFSAHAVTVPRKHRKHLGVDIMFRRRSRAELIAEYPPGSRDGSDGYFMPR